MEKSESIKELATALSCFQGEVLDAHKDKSGYGYKYADLSNILTMTRPLLAKNGLSVTQLCCSQEVEGSHPASIGVESILMHKSGEWLSSKYFMSLTPGKQMSLAQAAGSVITYARRYAYAAILGIAQTDNDATVNPKAIEKEREASLDILKGLISSRKVSQNEIRGWLEKAAAFDLDDLNEGQIVSLCNMLKKRK